MLNGPRWTYPEESVYPVQYPPFDVVQVTKVFPIPVLSVAVMTWKLTYWPDWT